MSDIAKAAGISRQALYLHFPNRAELLVSTVRHLDDINRVDDRLGPSRSAATGKQKLTAWIEVWGGYIPEIHGVAKALIAMKDVDEEARAAWDDRVQAVREGCAAAVHALANENALNAELSETEAVDLLWSLLSVETWEHLCVSCGWSADRYLATMQQVCTAALVRR